MAGAWNAGSMVLLGMMLIVMLVQPIMVSDTSVKPAEPLLSASGWVQLIYHDMEDSIADAPDYQSDGSWSWTTDYYHSPTISISMSDETLGWDYCTAEPCPSRVKADVWIRKGAPAGVPEFDFSLTDGLEPDEDGYTLVWDFANDKVSIVYRENGGSTETKLDEATLAVTYGSWYMMELEIDYDNGFIYGRIYNSNGELLAELESPITSTPTLKRTTVYGGGDQYIDDLVVYKYEETETGTPWRTPIIITNNVDKDLIGYQVKIVLDSNNWDGWSNVRDDGTDIYFTDSSGNPLYYWIENFDYTDQTTIIWVKVPNIPANGEVLIYMYYGGNNLYPDYNDPEKVFLFYDDFTGASLDTNKWITWDDTGATVTVSDSILDIYRPAGKRIKMNTTITFEVDTGVVLEAKQYVVQTSNYYYHTYAIGNDEVGFSSVGYVIYSGYESAIYTGDELRPPRTGTSSSLDGDIIDNPIGGVWQTIQFVIPANDYLKHKYDNNDWQVSIRYQGITCENAKLVMWFQAAGSYVAETKIDWIRVYKYIEPAPTINIGASEVVGGGVSFSGSVSPTTVSITLNGDNGYEYSVTFTMNVSNTGTVDSWSVAKLVDGRDDSVVFSENVTLAVNESTTLTYTHSFTLDDRGTYNWYYIVENDTVVFVNQTISITVNAEFEQSYEYTIQFSASMNPTVVTPYTFEYTLEPSAGQSISTVESHIYEYTINMSSSQTTTGISSHRNSQLLGSRVCMGIYLNDTNVYYMCTATVYTIAFRFQYIVESGEGYPDAYIKIYENDTGEMELYTSIYIPQGDTAVMLPANHTYAVEIPSTGTTIYGYSFELVGYDVNGEGEENTIILDRDYTFTITYRIYDDNSGGGNTPSSSITITITCPEFNASDLLPPTIGIGEPSLYSPEGIILVAMFIGIFIVFARVFPWGQALTVASILSAVVSILLFKSLTITGIFMALFMAGLIAWKVLGK